ncbi:MAG: GMC family oxidoreductase [Deltaproteobacteria bacterium]|jgi:choline dehydrogenase-like flavoprotein|nr:GMC family oxidoreductase [Deltaproteobacteria bacterium]
MIIDARSLSNNQTIDSDVCIVGAGVAGITLARECAGEEFQVCLLESGGLEPDKVTQSLYWGENIGHPYYPLDTARARFFGGTSHYWTIALGDNRLGVRLRPLDEIDFEEREWVPYSGWPFGRSHLDPFYERAQSICQIGPFTYNVEDWEDPVKTPRLPFVNDRVKTTIFQFGSRDLFFSEYRDEITRADNITTYLHANVVEVEATETAQTVTRLRVACLQGNKFWVSAKLFILAVGGIETPRLLLLSNNVQSAGLGNQNDLVGRFFMEHPHLWSGIYVPSDLNISTALYKVHTVNKVPVMGKLTVAEEVLRREKLLNYCVSIHPKLRYQSSASKGVDSFKVLRSAICRGDMPDDFSKHLGNVITDIEGIAINAYRKVRRKFDSEFKRSLKIEIFRLNHMTEQVPNPNSRVTLTGERDALGQNRIQLDWQLSPIDVRSIIRAQEIIDEELRRAGLGRLHIELHDETPPPDLHGGWHHMGTTRMHVDPKKGVVNENCRVHGISNLFIAGSSVFPTGGYANPVLTTVALVIRMADHIKKLMI